MPDLYASANDDYINSIALIDDIESLVWTDRYGSNGDFTLVTKNSIYFQSINAYDRYLFFSESQNVMMVETISANTEVNGDVLYTVTGRDLCKFMMDKDAKKTNTSIAGQTETYTGTPSNIMIQIINKYMIPGIANANDAIPNLVAYDLYNLPQSTITLNVQLDTVYNMVKSVGDAYGVGFGFQRSFYNGLPTLSINTRYCLDYTDVTTSYYREFSPDAENLVANSSVASVANYKNHARVLGAKTGVDVFLNPASPPTGPKRRTLVVEFADVGAADANGNTPSVAQDQAVLTQLGYAALADQANSYTDLVDGAIKQDYFTTNNIRIGDRFVVKDLAGVKNKKLITEEIWSVDNQGTTLTPTFGSY